MACPASFVPLAKCPLEDDANVILRHKMFTISPPPAGILVSSVARRFNGALPAKLHAAERHAA